MNEVTVLLCKAGATGDKINASCIKHLAGRLVIHKAFFFLNPKEM